MVFLLEMVSAPITNLEITHTLCPRRWGSRGREGQRCHLPPSRRGAWRHHRLHIARLVELFRNPGGAPSPARLRSLTKSESKCHCSGTFLLRHPYTRRVRKPGGDTFVRRARSTLPLRSMQTAGPQQAVNRQLPAPSPDLRRHL